MQLQSDKSSKLEEVKTQFRAREGYYRLMNSPDYSQRSQRAMGLSTGTTNSNSSTIVNEKTCIKISLVTINNSDDSMHGLRQQTTGFNQNFQPIKSTNDSNKSQHQRNRSSCDKKICFNVGRELFVYNYDGVRTGPDASNPIYKRSYKGSSPTCHDFNQTTATATSLSLLVGFSHGQVQLIDLNGGDDQESCREFNVDRLIDKTRVTCVKWIPNSPSLFLVAHASGHMYLYKDDLTCGSTAPAYQLFKQSDGVSIFTCKTKTTRNPIYKWVIGSLSSDHLAASTLSSINSESECFSINEFAFSPCAKYLACVSQDGFLRVYCYDTMELIGRARSYYGGLSCVCWSPDGKYVVTGGEDDLITVWSFFDRRVVARGMGHKSWVSVVAFDSFYSGYDLKNNDVDDDVEDDEDFEDKDLSNAQSDFEPDDDDQGLYIKAYDDLTRISRVKANGNAKVGSFSDNDNFKSNHSSHQCNNYVNQGDQVVTSYRFGSVGQDTQLCLWDLNDDLLRQPIAKGKPNCIASLNSRNFNNTSQSCNVGQSFNAETESQAQKRSSRIESSSVGEPYSEPNNQPNDKDSSSNLSPSPTVGFLSSKASGFTKTFSLVGKRDKRNQGFKSSDKNSLKGTLSNDSQNFPEDPAKLLGSAICPRMNEVPILEPTICKKISYERLTSLVFCKGGFITSCQDGYVFSWARPSKVCNSKTFAKISV